MIVALLISVSLLAARQVRAEANPSGCPEVVLTGDAISLRSSERRLVCGDPESEAWGSVTPAQARLSLRSFFQQRGYHAPVFRVREGVLFADSGPPTFIRRLSGRRFPAGVDLSKHRGIVGARLTPLQLDRVKELLTSDLENRGYACPVVLMSADGRTGEVAAEFSGGTVHLADPIEEAVSPGIDPGVFRRLEAFRRDRPLDRRLLTLTSRRIVRQALFSGSSYDVHCGSGGVRIVHRAVSAPPRLIRVGFGIDTEGLALFRTQWVHSRIGSGASTAMATLFASQRQQSVDASMRWYLAPSSRLHLLPTIAAARADEARFETVSSALGLVPAGTYDDQVLHLDFDAGPSFEYSDTRRGIGPERSTFLTFNSHLTASSHLFEYYRREPRVGFRVRLEATSRLAGLQSDLTAHRFVFRFEKLWNLGGFDPALWVLGARGWAGTTSVKNRESAFRQLPPAMRFFIGGDADYRGVDPGELGDENGFLTGVYHGLELRAADLLPYNLQPFVLLDAAMASKTSWRVGRNVYYAPGVGLRWSSFIGTFRATAARSQLWRRDPDTVGESRKIRYFFSYGREF